MDTYIKLKAYPRQQALLYVGVILMEHSRVLPSAMLKVSCQTVFKLFMSMLLDLFLNMYLKVAVLTEVASVPTQPPSNGSATVPPSVAPAEAKTLASGDLKTAVTLLKDIIASVEDLPDDHKEVVVSSTKFTTASGNC